MKKITVAALGLFLGITGGFSQLTLTSPIGGEVWLSGSTQNITWNCSGCPPTVDIELTTNGGGSWTTLVSGAPNTGSYSWTIPPMFTSPSANCLIQIKSGLFNDMSTSPFQISHPSISIIAPNGGETLISGQTYTISVSSANSFGGVLDYSINGGFSWTPITGLSVGFPGTVNYTWTVPNIFPAHSSMCLIRFNSGGPYADFSDSYFTITNTITVTSPNGGELLTIGGSHNITWNNTAGITNVAIDYSTDNGATWNIIDPMVPTGPSGGSYTWNPIPSPPSASCLIRVMDFMIPFVSDTSDANFSISSGTATVTSPNGGETWFAGNTHNITWTYTGPVSQYDIEYSTDNGSTWNPVATNVSVGAGGGSYAWTVPNTPSNQCLVRVTDMVDPTRTDVSNSVFTIAVPTITLTSPNGMENLLVGSTHNITWNSVGPIPAVDIFYSTDNGANWTNIVYNQPNGVSGGSFLWSVPNTPSNQCLVRVNSSLNPGIVDQSDGVFTISLNLPRSLTLISPNGGETFTAGSSQNINWGFTGGVNQILLEFSSDNGASWSSIATVPVTSSPYSWTVPNSPSTQGLIRITDTDSTTVSDVSDGNFSIVLPAELSQLSNESAVKIYPNPVNSWLTVDFGTADPGVIEILNVDGKVIRKVFPQENKTVLNLEDLNSGFYLIRIGQNTHRFIKM